MVPPVRVRDLVSSTVSTNRPPCSQSAAPASCGAGFILPQHRTLAVTSKSFPSEGLCLLERETRNSLIHPLSSDIAEPRSGHPNG